MTRLDPVDDPEYFEYIGEDRKIHLCKPHEDTCYCGVKVLRKKVTYNDREKLYSCYECTY
jgi:hypothetical protein